MPLSDEQNVIFLHIPKTGGTTIRKLFHLDKFVDENPKSIPSPQHLTCELLRIFLGSKRYNNYYKFTFIRNPWGRLLSDFFWRKDRKGIREIGSFEDYVDFAKLKVRYRSFYEEPFLDHFIPQVDYTIDADDVFRFEAFEQGVRVLEQKLGIELGSIDKKPIKASDKYWEFYNKRTKAIVAEVYAEDIEMFGYEFEGENRL